MTKGSVTDNDRKAHPMVQRPLNTKHKKVAAALLPPNIALDTKIAKRTQTDIPVMTGMRSRSAPDAMSPITNTADNVAMLPPALPRVAVSPLAPVKPVVNGPSKA